MTKKTKKTNLKKRAFSLIELMVVIIILGLLASFVLPSLTGKGEEAKKQIVCVQMQSISQALKMYKIDNSTYPSTSEGLNILLDKGYFEDNKIPNDSWKNPYIYTSNGTTYEIISLGADKKEGGDDDIYFSQCGSAK